MMDSFQFLLEAYPHLFPLLSLGIGALVGSFLNVCIYRIPAEQSVITPGSHCACGKSIPFLSQYSHFLVVLAAWPGPLLSGSLQYPLSTGGTVDSTALCRIGMDAPPHGGPARYGLYRLSDLRDLYRSRSHDHPRPLFNGRHAISTRSLDLRPRTARGGGEHPATRPHPCRTGVPDGRLDRRWAGLLGGCPRRTAIWTPRHGRGRRQIRRLYRRILRLARRGIRVFGGALFGTVLLLPWLLFLKCKAPNARAESEEAPAVAGLQVPFGPFLALAGLAYFLGLNQAVDLYFQQVALNFGL